MSMTRYPSIVGQYKGGQINTIKNSLPESTIWVAEEKIDGSNFQLEVADLDVRFHSRTVADIDKTPNFFVDPSMVDDIKALAREIYTKLSNTLGQSTESVKIFTEYFGGYYGDGSLVMRKPLLQRVLYSRHPKVIVFSINHNGQWLSPRHLETLSEGETWPFIKYLAKGSLNDLLKLDLHYPTTIPKRYGLPPLENNLAEGYVLKPYDNVRVINNFFTCIKRVRWGKTPDKIKIKTKVLNATQKTIAAGVKELCDKERYYSTLSKYPGTWDAMSDEDRIKAILGDARDEYLVNHPLLKQKVDDVVREYHGLTEHVRKLLL